MSHWFGLILVGGPWFVNVCTFGAGAIALGFVETRRKRIGRRSLFAGKDPYSDYRLQ